MRLSPPDCSIGPSPWLVNVARRIGSAISGRNGELDSAPPHTATLRLVTWHDPRGWGLREFRNVSPPEFHAYLAA